MKKRDEFWVCDVYTQDQIYHDVTVRITQKFGERILSRDIHETGCSEVIYLPMEAVVFYKESILIVEYDD